MKYLISTALIASLTACAAPAPLSDTHTVDMPVSIRCHVTLPVAPAFATAALPSSADIFDEVKALLVEREQHIGYEQQLTGALKSCQ